MNKVITKGIYEYGKNFYDELLEIMETISSEYVGLMKIEEIDEVVEKKTGWMKEAVIFKLQNIFRLDSFNDVDSSYSSILESIECNSDYQAMFEELVDLFGIEVR